MFGIPYLNPGDWLTLPIAQLGIMFAIPNIHPGKTNRSQGNEVLNCKLRNSKRGGIGGRRVWAWGSCWWWVIAGAHRFDFKMKSIWTLLTILCPASPHSPLIIDLSGHLLSRIPASGKLHISHSLHTLAIKI